MHSAAARTKLPLLPHRHAFMVWTSSPSHWLASAALYKHDCAPEGYAEKSLVKAAAAAAARSTSRRATACGDCRPARIVAYVDVRYKLCAVRCRCSGMARLQ